LASEVYFCEIWHTVSCGTFGLVFYSYVLPKFLKQRATKQNFCTIFGLTERRGGEKVNKKIIGLGIALSVVAVFAAPVLAIGPQNAVKNPNADFTVGWSRLYLPSGLFTEWVPYGDQTLFFQHKGADKFQIGNAIEMTIDSPDDLGLFFAMENKWIYLTQGSYAMFLVFVGLNPNEALPYPDGLYIRMVMIGK
jgi:hypothetical protein